jgi:diguanylate cyclase (GGDEF)-like protein
VILPRQGLRWRQGDARPRRLPDGSTLWHGYISDVTDRKHIEAELQAFALLDFLTQLPNRRCIMVRMEEELARIRRTDVQSTAVLMCDLDFFKRINDGYGHAIGDLVLKRFSDILSGTLRQNDIAGRIGGEEFAVILPAAGVIEAYCFAERLQSEIAQTSFNEGGVSIPVTVSIGITLMKATDVNAEAALSRSDMALYRAKRNGRNCIQTIVD